MAVDRIVQDKIRQAAADWLREGRMFTAFEISLEVKAEGVRERHRNMKEFIHQVLAELGGQHNYTRTLRDVGAPIHAWLYHKIGDNPFMYRPLPRHDSQEDSDEDNTVAAATPADSGLANSGLTDSGLTDSGLTDSGPAPDGVRNPALLSSSNPQPASILDGAYGADHQGRLALPTDLLANLGLQPGQQAAVTIDAENEEIRLSRPIHLGLATADLTLTLDQQGVVRLDPETLKKANLHSLQSYHVVGRGNIITVRAYT